MSPAVSVIVRSKDRAHTIRESLASIRAQDTDAEIVVVDSGSTDGTVQIAREYADQVIEIPADQFTYGGALNDGARAASADIHVALSSHCVLPDNGWLSRCIAHYEDDTVAGASGDRFGPDGKLLRSPVRHDQDPSLDTNPYWGYANHAGSWRRSVWEQVPFSTKLVACEDKEWDRLVRERGFAVIIDPSLAVRAVHRRRQGVGALYGRAKREGAAIRAVTGKAPATLRDVAREWTTLQERSAFVQLANPYRVIDIAGRYVGERREPAELN